MSGDNRFAKHERLRSKQDFERLFERRCSVGDERLQIIALPNDLPYSRVGIAVPKRTGSAVVRNRWKRVCREAYRLTKHELPAGLDMVLMPRGRDKPQLAEIRESLRRLAPQVARKLERESKR
jgi:ribonuclease P protein component